MKSFLQIAANISRTLNAMERSKLSLLQQIRQTAFTGMHWCKVWLLPPPALTLCAPLLHAGRLWHRRADVLQREERVGVVLQRQHGRRPGADPGVLLPARLPAQLQPHPAGSDTHTSPSVHFCEWLEVRISCNRDWHVGTFWCYCVDWKDQSELIHMCGYIGL